MSKAHINSNLNITNTIVGYGANIEGHYPFKDKVNDIIYGATPSTNSNTTLTDDGIVVEEATTNLLYNVNFESALDPNYFVRGLAYTLFIDSTEKYNSMNSLKIVATSFGSAGVDIQMNTTSQAIASTEYTFSFYAKALEETIFTVRWGYGEGSSSVLIGTEWDKYSLIAKTGTTIYPGILPYFDMATTLWINSPQLEKKSFATSFVNGSRGDSSLSLVSNKISELTDWTVACWVYPCLNYAYNAGATRINFYSIGSYYTLNQSDVQWSRGWGATAKNTIQLQGYLGQESQKVSSVVTLSDIDASNWGLYIIRFDSTNKKIKGDILGVSGTHYNIPAFTHPLTGLPNNIIVGGYGWDKDNSNSIFKDLIIYSKYLNDYEITALYNSALNFNIEEGVCT